MFEAGESSASAKLRVLRGARLLAIPLALVLFYSSIREIVEPSFDPPWFFRFRGVLEILLGLILLLPFQRIAEKSPRGWTKLFCCLLVISVVFVFARVIGVLFEARVIEAAGGELGLPAWSGTLIFFALAQIPVILFLRFPDQLD